MSKRFFAPFTSSISKERLEGYRRASSDTNLDLFARYSWNIALCEALYPSLNVLEIALRNELYAVITRTFDPYWLDRIDSHVLKTQEQDFVRKVQGKLRKSGKSPFGGTLITELSFGFWTRFFNAKYELLVRKLLRDRTGFLPGLPRHSRKRHTLSTRMNQIRYLRNRVFHHEPIWHWHGLARKHDEILEGIYWLNPSLREYVEHIDRFPDVHRKSENIYRDSLEKLLKSKGYA